MCPDQDDKSFRESCDLTGAAGMACLIVLAGICVVIGFTVSYNNECNSTKEYWPCVGAWLLPVGVFVFFPILCGLLCWGGCTAYERYDDWKKKTNELSVVIESQPLTVVGDE